MNRVWLWLAAIGLGSVSLVILLLSIPLSALPAWFPDPAQAGQAGYNAGSSIIPMIFGVCIAYVVISHFTKKKEEGKQP